MEPAGNYAGKRKQYSRRNFPVPEPMISHIFQSPDCQRMPQYPVGITMESSPYPTGNDWKQQRDPPEIIGNYNLSKTEKIQQISHVLFNIFSCLAQIKTRLSDLIFHHPKTIGLMQKYSPIF